jgi:ABC-type glycerol-3-phosphate transport system permease component
MRLLRAGIGRMMVTLAVLVVLALVWLVPVITALMTSIRPLPQIREGWWHLAGATFTAANFSRAWVAGLSDAVVNSLIIAVGATIVTTGLGTLAAYAFARLQFRGKALACFLLISTMIVPIQIILIPLVPWFQTLGLNDGEWLPFLGIVLVHTGFGAGWAIFMLTPSSPRSRATCSRPRTSTAPATSMSSAASCCRWRSPASCRSRSSTSSSCGTTCCWR